MRDAEKQRDVLFEHALAAEEAEFDYCERCKSNQPHQEFSVPTYDNPYEFEWVCMTCYKTTQEEAPDKNQEEVGYEKETPQTR